MSYGNEKNHRDINGFIVQSFVKNEDKAFMNDFKNYKFNLDNVRLSGSYISKSGLFNPGFVDNLREDFAVDILIHQSNSTYTEEIGLKTPEEWIILGGYSADVPEVPASLRHFYDPTKPKGEGYLTDKVNSKIMATLQRIMGNPKTDGVEWALGKKGSYAISQHNYSWENGKAYIKGALEESNIDKRNKFMAKAWRSLGQTLHMIADNGCPAHVRNDGHPSIPYYFVEYFGNPDFYEENMADKSLIGFEKGPVPTSLQSNLKKTKSIKDVAHELALFTNSNFFTTETISGYDWKGNKVSQITHPDYEYNSPQLSANSYNKNYYRSNIDGVGEVILATDTWFFAKYPIAKTYPYLNEDCVISQAKVLIPSIMEAGRYAMKYFIPKIEINILKVEEDGTIHGEIKHKTDSEYKDEIRFNGPVAIKQFGVSELAILNANNGKFSGKIKVEEKTYVKAEIEFGGVAVQSKQFTINVTKKTEEIESVVDLNEKKPTDKAWVLTDTKIEDKADRLVKKNKSYKNVYTYKQNLSNNSLYCKQTYIGGTDTYYNPAKVKGEGLGAQFNWTGPPKFINPGDIISLQLSGSLSEENLSFFGFGFQISAGACIYTKGADDANWCESLRNKEGKNTFSISKKSNSFNETVSMDNIPKGESDEILYINVSGGIEGARTQYIYEWK